MSLQLARFILGTIIAVCYMSIGLTMAVAENNSASEMQNSKALQAVSTGMNQFAAELYKKASDDSTNNLVCSPLSISLLYSMLSTGFSEDIEKYLSTGLYLPNNSPINVQGFQLLIDSLNNVKNVELSVANNIFVNNDFTIDQKFKIICTNSFDSEVQNENLENYQEASKTINTWCEEKTKNLVHDVIKPSNFNESTLALVNAVYFKGVWENKFDAATTNKAFYVKENIGNDVPMMTQRNRFNYGAIPDLDATFIELPYQSQNEKESISMFIIRPSQIGGLKKARDSIEKINFKKLHEEKHVTDIELSIPKFTVESTMDPRPIFNEMGMSYIFEYNISSISNGPLNAGKVNEVGSEVAAVTAIMAFQKHPMLPPPEPIVLSIDRPFIYVIYHASTNSILFQGHILQLSE